MQRIEREVTEGKQRAKNRKREHANHGWKVIREINTIVLMDCPCGWCGWMTKDSI